MCYNIRFILLNKLFSNNFLIKKVTKNSHTAIPEPLLLNIFWFLVTYEVRLVNNVNFNLFSKFFYSLYH